MTRLRAVRSDDQVLETWLEDWYEPAFRAAYLILLDREEAESAVHEGFLRAWRFRAGAPEGGGTGVWILRAVVSSCRRRLRSSGPPPIEGRQDAGLAALGALATESRVVVALRGSTRLGEREVAEVVRRRPAAVRRSLEDALGQLGPEITASEGRREMSVAGEGR
jgi:DNA-directed RNA polymerase specialized sigma24 family protein